MFRKPLENLKIAISGGSVAGCSAAILLQQLGAEVTVFERSSHPREGRGAGIVLPEAFIKSCVEKGLFDADMPRLPVASRSFSVKDGREIWRQPAFVVSTLKSYSSPKREGAFKLGHV